MEYVNAYTKCLLKSFNKKNQELPVSEKQKYTKPNKNMHYSTGKLYYECEGGDIEKLNEFALANLSLLGSDILEDLELTDALYNLNEQEKDKALNGPSYSFDKIKRIYETKYEEFLNDTKDEKFLDNLFTNYASNFKNIIDPYNKEIVKLYNDSTKTNDKIDNLSYNEYKRSGFDYFDVTKKYYDSLTKELPDMVNLMINLKKYEDQKSLDFILLSYLTPIKFSYEKRCKNIFERLEKILRMNKLVTNWEENYCNFVKNYLGYMNFIYFSKDMPNTNFYNFILHENYKGNIPLLNSLLKKYGYISKAQALDLCEEISKISVITMDSYENRFRHGIKKLFPFIFADVSLNIKYKNIFKRDIENDNVEQLINDLKEYETYSASNYQYESVVKLNLYALIKLINEKIYNDLLINREFNYNNYL